LAALIGLLASASIVATPRSRRLATAATLPTNGYPRREHPPFRLNSYEFSDGRRRARNYPVFPHDFACHPLLHGQRRGIK
jgi:hypothetical protein